MKFSVIGSNENSCTKEQTDFAFQLGKYLVDNDHTIVNGGMGGTMEAVAKGARESEKFAANKVIGILPGEDVIDGNSYSGIKIVTELGSGRNRLVVLNGDFIIAIGGGAGTLNEISIAWILQKPIAAYTHGGGWATKLAGKQIDDRRNDIIFPISNLEDINKWISITKF